MQDVVTDSFDADHNISGHHLENLRVIRLGDVLAIELSDHGLVEPDHLHSVDLEALLGDLRHDLTRMQVGVWLDQHEGSLPQIDLVHVLFGLLVCKLPHLVLPAVDGDLAAHVQVLLAHCLVLDPPQVHLAAPLIDELD